MLHVRLDSINEIPFNQLKSNKIIAAITLLPIEMSHTFFEPLESPTSYSQKIISFPIPDSPNFSVRISLQIKQDSSDICEVIFPLQYFRINRFYKFRAQMASELLSEPPTLDLSLQISTSKYKPFECHRSHVSFDIEHEEKGDSSDNQSLAQFWFAIVPEEQWSLIFRTGFYELIKEEIENYDNNDLQVPQKPQETFLKGPKRGEYQLVSLDKNPLNPPSPTNEPLPKTFPSSLIETHFI